MCRSAAIASGEIADRLHVATQLFACKLISAEDLAKVKSLVSTDQAAAGKAAADKGAAEKVAADKAAAEKPVSDKPVADKAGADEAAADKAAAK